MASVRVYQRRQLRLDLLSFRQRQMYELGMFGVAAVKERLAAARGPEDQPAKPLTKRYAIWKTRQGKGNRRNLWLTGEMLTNFTVRTVSENRAKANVSTRKDRIKAWANQKREAWMVFSPKNKAAVLEAARKMLDAIKPRLLLERDLGGRQR
jgi:hypothetical protein